MKTKLGIEPKVSMAMGELAVVVDGREIYSYKKSGAMPKQGQILAEIEALKNKTA